MAPQLVPCSFCDRLYTHYSIDLHQPQCLSNPNRKVKLPQLKRTAHSSIGPSNSTTKPLPALPERRSRSVGSNSMNSSNSSVESNNNNENENRPATRSMNVMNGATGKPPKSRSTNRLNSSSNKRHKVYKSHQSLLTDLTKRICFVCGEKVPIKDLLDHEIECEAEWHTLRREFPSTIRVKSPKQMRIPSVDGTVDPTRMDYYATESAEQAQKTRCLRCCRHVPFAHVLQHQCTRFQPTVQFYF